MKREVRNPGYVDPARLADSSRLRAHPASHCLSTVLPRTGDQWCLYRSCKIPNRDWKGQIFSQLCSKRLILTCVRWCKMPPLLRLVGHITQALRYFGSNEPKNIWRLATTRTWDWHNTRGRVVTKQHWKSLQCTKVCRELLAPKSDASYSASKLSEPEAIRDAQLGK